MTSKFKKFLGETRGIAAIEVALVLPFLLLIYFGLFDLTSLISVNRKVTYAASVMADLVALNKTSVLKSNIQDYYAAANMVMAPTPAASVRVEVFGYRISGATITQVWKTDNAEAVHAARRLPLLPWPPSWLQETTWWWPASAQPTRPMLQTSLATQILGDTPFQVGETITQRPRSSLQLTCYNTAVGGAVCS